ncbi:hypothetical protein SETIT_1G173500v2 [Setaria italica]|uniref:Uncharacterized protein n=1 Tax=Setaria italica TaxID=4555 RepID=A0A368PLN1_SETIT|nr:hypothetical protein SETIT_1G173500v2 [Setaria italica]
MGSVLSSTCVALCSFVGALLDKVEMWQMMAAYPQLRAEEREDLRRWFRDQDAEQDARDAAARLRGRDLRLSQRCKYKHPC